MYMCFTVTFNIIFLVLFCTCVLIFSNSCITNVIMEMMVMMICTSHL